MFFLHFKVVVVALAIRYLILKEYYSSMVNSNEIVVLDLDDLLVDWSELLSVEC